jgi:hypothetical protein
MQISEVVAVVVVAAVVAVVTNMALFFSCNGLIGNKEAKN